MLTHVNLLICSHLLSSDENYCSVCVYVSCLTAHKIIIGVKAG